MFIKCAIYGTILLKSWVLRKIGHGIVYNFIYCYSLELIKIILIFACADCGFCFMHGWFNIGYSPLDARDMWSIWTSSEAYESLTSGQSRHIGCIGHQWQGTGRVCVENTDIFQIYRAFWITFNAARAAYTISYPSCICTGTRTGSSVKSYFWKII